MCQSSVSPCAPMHRPIVTASGDGGAHLDGQAGAELMRQQGREHLALCVVDAAAVRQQHDSTSWRAARVRQPLLPPFKIGVVERQRKALLQLAAAAHRQRRQQRRGSITSAVVIAYRWIQLAAGPAPPREKRSCSSCSASGSVWPLMASAGASTIESQRCTASAPRKVLSQPAPNSNTRPRRYSAASAPAASASAQVQQGGDAGLLQRLAGQRPGGREALQRQRRRG